jgi:predicted amidohydrolase
MNICLIQTYPEGRRSNIEYLKWTMSQYQADLYVLPELFTTGFDYLADPRHWPTDAEVIPDGLTCRQIHGFLKGRSSAVVCGLLEQVGQDYYNIAAVIGDGTIERYRQKYPATSNNGRVLPIEAGDYQTITVLLQDSLLFTMGFMICSECYMAAAFFEEYKRRGVNAVVLIADSSNRTWIKEFPHYCREYGLPAIVCNAAGPNGGESCIINAAGEFVPLWTPQGNRDSLTDNAVAALGVI